MRPLYPIFALPRTGLIAGLFMLAACDGGAQLPGGQALDSNVKGSIQGSFLVESLQPSAAGPGSELVLRGAGLTAGMAVLIAGVPAKVLGWEGDHTVKVEVPRGSPGMQTVTVQKNGEASSLSFLRLAGDGEAMVSGSLALVCKGQSFYDVEGKRLEGTRECDKAPAPQTIGSEQIKTGSVTGAHLLSGSIGRDALAPGSVNDKILADFAVSTPKLADGAVTGVKIAPATITASQLAAGAVGPVQLAASSIELRHFGDMQCATGQVVKWNGTAWACGDDHGVAGALTVTSADVQDGTLTDIDIAAGAAIAASKIAGVFASTQIPALDAGKITTGTFSAAFLAADSVTASKIDDGAVLRAHLNLDGCTPGQVLKVSGSVWTCGDDVGGAVTNLGTGQQIFSDIAGQTIRLRSLKAGTNVSMSGTATEITINAGNANWDTAFTDRLKWDGSTSGLDPAVGRTSLGLGSIAQQNASSVAITGGTLAGVTIDGWTTTGLIPASKLPTATSSNPGAIKATTGFMTVGAGGDITGINAQSIGGRIGMVGTFADGKFLKLGAGVQLIGADIAGTDIPVATNAARGTLQATTARMTLDGSGSVTMLSATRLQSTNVDATAPTDGQILRYVSGSSAWVPSNDTASAVAATAVQSATSVGSGTAIVAGKNGTALEFKSLSASGGISILTTGNLLSFSTDPSGIDIADTSGSLPATRISSGNLTLAAGNLSLMAGNIAAAAGNISASGRVSGSSVKTGQPGALPTCNGGSENGIIWTEDSGRKVYSCVGSQKVLLARDGYHVMFATRESSYSGNLGGIHGANARCQEAAMAANLEGWPHFVALLSSGTVDAIDRIKLRGPVLTTTGVQIDTAVGFWDGSHAAAAGVDEYGSAVTGWALTGTDSDGTKASHCASWTVANTSAATNGNVVDTNSDWTNEFGGNCQQTIYRLYCISQ